MLKKLLSSVIAVSAIGVLLVPFLVQAAPFFKEKEVIYEIPTMKDDPLTAQKKINTHYRINKISGMDVSYTKYYNGVMNINEENKVVSSTVFDDNKKFKVVNVEYLPITVIFDEKTKKWSISTEIFFTKADAMLAASSTMFAPPDASGKPWVVKVDDPKLVIKSKS